MAFDQSFLIALLLLVVGCGFLKGNISAQVGALYADDDSPGRTRGFVIFSTAINVGAVIGPLSCGLLAQVYGWHAGFGLAGVLMLLGLATYLAGYRTLTEQTATVKGVVAAAHAKLNGAQWRVVAALTVVMLLTIFQSVAYYQNTNIGLIWIDQQVDLNLFGFQIPVAWFASIDPLVSIVAVPPLIALWRWQQSHGGEPAEIGKIAIGAWMACAANLLLVIGCLQGGHVSALYPLVYNVLLGVAFLYYWPTLLALVSHAAPARVKSTMMGVAFLSLFSGNIVIGRLGSFYETLGPTSFWLLSAGVAAAGGTLALVLRKPLGRVLDSR